MITVNIVDSIMGSGKTQAAINYINNSDDSKHFLYVTPYLKEVERIINSCPNKHFRQPEKYGSKITGIKDLLNKGRNIATTHTLFHLFDDEIIDLCYSQGYILIMDEVTDVIDTYYIGEKDRIILLNNFVTVDETTGLLRWRDDQMDYGSSPMDDKFIEEKRLCEMNCLAIYGNNIMLWMFPIKIFEAFRESYILTYMFNAQMQKYYYDYYNIKYKYIYVNGDAIDNYHFAETNQNNISKYDYRKLIHIYNDEKLNMIGDSEHSLSMSWYKRNINNNLIKQLKKNTINYFNNILKSKSSNNIWTTFKDYKELIAGKGYTKGFISSSMRATNDYQDRTAIAYLVNKFFNPYVKQFFLNHNISVDEEGYAVSEMLQFIWRSAVRKGEEINIYIPSKRMRLLLQKWINEQKYE